MLQRWQDMWRGVALECETDAEALMVDMEQMRVELGDHAERTLVFGAIELSMHGWLLIAEVCYVLAGGRDPEPRP